MSNFNTAGGSSTESHSSSSSSRAYAAQQKRQRDQRNFLIGTVTLAAAALIGVIFFAISQGTFTNPSRGSSAGDPADSAGSSEVGYAGIPQGTTSEGMHYLGSPYAQISIMEFSNFSCPHCEDYVPTFDQIVNRAIRDGRARIIFVPQVFNDAGSIRAAQAALCAGMQGKFWEMHDVLFRIHGTVGTRFEQTTIEQGAESIGVDIEEMNTCIASEEMIPVLQTAMDIADDLGVRGTPTLLHSTDGSNFIYFKSADGRAYTGGGVPLEDVLRTIDEANS
jgi:protein-disulfide isomerase